MAIITAPAFALKQVDWTLDRPAQINRSAYTGTRTVVANPWHGIWRAKVTLRTEQGEAAIRTLRGFFASLKGQINTFQLTAVETAQHGSGTSTAAAIGAQGATTITLNNTPPLTAGMLATVTLPSGNLQMVMLTAAIAGSVITFEPPLREAIAIGALVDTANPTCLVALASSAFGWGVSNWRRYDIGFDVEEAF